MRLERAALLVWLACAAGSSGCLGPGPPSGPNVMVAGWDFSQYPVDGALSWDGRRLSPTLPSNYSDFDLTSGAGAESAPFGTMHLDGKFGSPVTPLDFHDPFVPSAAARGSLRRNLDAPAGVRFDCFKVLRQEGQYFAGPLTMTALAEATVVFAGDLGPVAEVGRDWSVRFAARTSRGRIPLRVESSADGASYRRVAELELTEEETLVATELDVPEGERAFVRLTLGPDAEARPRQQAFVDNFALFAHLVLPPGAEPTPRVQMTQAERECRTVAQRS